MKVNSSIESYNSLKVTIVNLKLYLSSFIKEIKDIESYNF